MGDNLRQEGFRRDSSDLNGCTACSCCHGKGAESRLVGLVETVFERLNDENGRLVERNEKLYQENLRLKSNLESNLADTSESSNLILVGRVVYDDILRLDKQKLDKLDSALRNIRNWFLSTSVGYVSAGIEGHRRFIMLFQSLGVRYLAMVEGTIGSWEAKWSAFENKSLGCLERLEGLLENRIWWANHDEARWFAICFVDTLRALLKLRGIEK